MTASTKDLENRALIAYMRKTAKLGGSIIQPSRPQVTTIGDKKYVLLTNVNGILAVYRVRQDGKLKGLVRWPKEFDEA